MFPLPPNEVERLAELSDLDLRAPESDRAYAVICELACGLFEVPTCLVSLVDEREQWFKAKCGFALDSTPRDISFCTYTILGADPLIVEDATRDARFKDNPLVTGTPKIRFYAGVPLIVGPGAAVGSFCIIDRRPRRFTRKQVSRLQDLAGLVLEQLKARKAERRARDIAASYRLLADHSRDMIVRGDTTGTRRYVSPAAREVLGWDPEELLGLKSLDTIHPDDRPRLHAMIEELKSGTRREAVSQHRCRHKDGRYVWVEANLATVVDEDTQKCVGYVAAVRDIARRRSAEEALRISEERLALAIENGNDGFWDWAAESKQLWFSHQLLRKLGYAPDEVSTSLTSWLSLIHPEDRARVRGCFIEHLAGATGAYECEHRLRRKDGSYSWFLVRGKVTSRGPNGRALRVVGTLLDISARKDAEQRVEYLANHDPLTELPNRLRFNHRLVQQLGLLGERRPCAILLGDLNRFKVVNDTLGHHLGDLVLKEAARRLRSCVSADDLVARLGGDEFAILMCRPQIRAEDAAALAKALVTRFAEPMVVGGKTVEVGLSLGISLAPSDGTDDLTLLRRADLALYRAKREARASFSFFESSMDDAIEERFRLSHELRGAIGRNELDVFYQPIVCAATGQIRCAEALLRWTRPDGDIPPSVFIPLAEECGLIGMLGEFGLERACREARSWAPDIRLAVNVSADQLSRAEFVTAFATTVAHAGLAPERLELEITESVLMRNDGICRSNLERLKGMGVRLSLDDFGTGYSSLSYLRQFRFDKIKIDGSFVRELGDPKVMTVVRAILEIGRGLDVTITAEGVETAEQVEILRREGCAELQGFFFARPLNAARFAHFRSNRISL